MMIKVIVILVLCATVAGEEFRDGRLVGSWVKHHTRQEGSAYKSDANWNLTVTFRDNGDFLWQSIRTDGEKVADESVKGTYSIKRALLTFKFRKPSPAARKRLPEHFAFWPSKLVGQQTYRLQDDYLVLGHDGHKLWHYLKRKNGVKPRAELDKE